MAVVTAGMHDACVAGAADPGAGEILFAFRNGQGIDVGPKEQGLSRSLAVDPGDEPALVDEAVRNAVFIELFGDIGNGLILLL